MTIRSSRGTKMILGWVVILAMLVPAILQFAVLTRTDPLFLWGIAAIVLGGVWLWRVVSRRAADAATRDDDLDPATRRDDGW